MIGASAYWVGNRPWTAPVSPLHRNGISDALQQFDWLSGDHICEQHVHNLERRAGFAGGDPVMGTHPVSARTRRLPAFATSSPR